eukprot:2343417-Rhodomonas_salina.1
MHIRGHESASQPRQCPRSLRLELVRWHGLTGCDGAHSGALSSALNQVSASVVLLSLWRWCTLGGTIVGIGASLSLGGGGGTHVAARSSALER